MGNQRKIYFPLVTKGNITENGKLPSEFTIQRYDLHIVTQGEPH